MNYFIWWLFKENWKTKDQNLNSIKFFMLSSFSFWSLFYLFFGYSSCSPEDLEPQLKPEATLQAHVLPGLEFFHFVVGAVSLILLFLPSVLQSPSLNSQTLYSLLEENLLVQVLIAASLASFLVCSLPHCEYNVFLYFYVRSRISAAFRGKGFDNASNKHHKNILRRLLLQPIFHSGSCFEPTMRVIIVGLRMIHFLYPQSPLFLFLIKLQILLSCKFFKICKNIRLKIYKICKKFYRLRKHFDRHFRKVL